MSHAASPPPRTLFVCGGTFVYGFERVILRYLKGLADRGFPLYATVNGWNDGVFAAALQEIGVPYEFIKVGWIYVRKPSWTFETLRRYPRGVMDFRRIARAFRPEVVVHSGYRTLAALYWTLDDNNVVAVQEYWTKPWEHRLVRRLDRKVRAYIACSQDIARHLHSIGLPEDKIVQIYNSMDFPAAPPARAARQGPFVFGVTGQVIERKGHHVILDAIARVVRMEPDAAFCLKIFGNGEPEYIARLKRQADELGISSYIEWCGYRTSCDDYYPLLDCALVLTTIPDPCPLAAIEPGAYTLPAITSTAGGLAELVLDGETGFLVPPDDADALAGKMLAMLSSPENAAEMGRRAFVANKRRFEEPKIMSELVELLTKVAAHSSDESCLQN